MWAGVLFRLLCRFPAVLHAYSRPKSPEYSSDPSSVRELAGGQLPPAGAPGRARRRHRACRRVPRSPLLQTAPREGQQVSQQSFSPRSQYRAERARDPCHRLFCQVWGSTEAALPEGTGGWQVRCGRPHPPPPLTSVSMGSTSIPFHSSSKWAIGMLGDAGRKPRSSRWETRRPPRKAGGGRRC